MSRAAPMWTESQRRAIGVRSSLVISAGAGAGKTSVLIERLISRLSDPAEPADIDRFLFLTFTDAAATEMRLRLARRLEEILASLVGTERTGPRAAHLRRQIHLLDRAQVCTLHAFCLDLVRRFGHLRGLDPQARVMDEEEAALLRLETLDRLFERAYDGEVIGDRFFRLLDAFGGAEADRQLRRVVLSLHQFCESLPDGTRRLAGWAAAYPEQARAEDFIRSHWAGQALRGLAGVLGRARGALEHALQAARQPAGPAAYEAAFESVMGLVDQAWAAASQEEWEAAAALMSPPLAFPRLPAVRESDGVDPQLKDRASVLWAEAKDLLQGAARRLFSRDAAGHAADLEALRPAATGLEELTAAFAEAYLRAKRLRGVYDFSDMERLALEILTEPDGRPSGVALELRRRFEEILVDEAQDINPVQDALLQLLSGPDGRIVRVGDIKQCIYRFRLAAPDLFAEAYRRAVPAEEDLEGGQGVQDGGEAKRPLRIDLRENFRSRRPVIEAVNQLFGEIMTEELGEVEYDEAAQLVYAAPYPDGGDGRGGPAVEVHLIDREIARKGAGDTGEEELEDAEAAEAAFVARRIRRLLDSGAFVHAPGGGKRPLRPGDICVLLRSLKGRVNAYAAALEAESIPVQADQSPGFFEAVEIETMLALLAAIENPLRDIPFTAAIGSVIGGMDAEDLARIRLHAPDARFYEAFEAVCAQGEPAELREKARAFHQKLERWRDLAQWARLSHLILTLYQETGYVSYAEALPGGAQRKANLEALYRMACRFDRSARGGLSRFLRYMEDLAAEGGELSAGRRPEGRDAVQVMSVHRSKGLEFPVVIVADLGRAMQPPDRGGPVIFERDAGLGLIWVDPEAGAMRRTLPYEVVREARRRQELSEEARILYVACTRARERLILVGSARKLGERWDRWSHTAGAGRDVRRAFYGGAQTALDWLGPALALQGVQPAPGLLDGGEQKEPAAAEAEGPWRLFFWTDRIPAAAGSVDEAAAAAGAELQEREARAEADAYGEEEGGPERAPAGLWDEYAYKEAAQVPAKATVSALVRVQTEERLPAPDEETAFQWTPSPLRRPNWEGPWGGRRRIDAAEIGRGVHLLLERIDLSGPCDEAALAELAQDLEGRELLPHELTPVLPLSQIAAFLASPLGRRLRRADLEGGLEREVTFTCAMPADRLPGGWAEAGGVPVGDAPPVGLAGEKVVVQGVIDAVMRDGDGLVIVDYKTDRVDGETGGLAPLIERYAPQVRLYAQAAELVYGLPVREKRLAFLRAGRDVEVE